MARHVEEIVEDISKRSDEELLERIQELRRTRNIRATVSTKGKDRPATKSKKKDTLVSLLAGMSVEEREQLITSMSKKGEG